MKIDDFNLSAGLKKEISSVISLNKLPHAIIIEKGDYYSRIDFSFFLAACALCDGEGESPCGECRNCMKAFRKIHPDILLYERENGKKEFSVKIIRDFIKPAAYVKAGEANGKVFIIKDAETMNISAQNAMLKIFEEPPESVIFILCCDNSTALLETIRSRATVYSMGLTDGNDEKEINSREIAVELVNSLMLPTEYEFMEKTGVFEKDRELLVLTLHQMQKIFRDAVFIKNGVNVEDNEEIAVKASSFMGMSNLLNLIEKTNELKNFAEKNANLNLLLTRFCSCLRQAARG